MIVAGDNEQAYRALYDAFFRCAMLLLCRDAMRQMSAAAPAMRPCYAIFRAAAIIIRLFIAAITLLRHMRRFHAADATDTPLFFVF